ncbi:MAG: helix-turn-helix transcriptional regulator [Phenylobacterium sp.]|nr:helix-turn-helix transcriptional regulator [Phenylobacterium sp.]MBJ7412848.1 helix-turn-helix transcriptional regulator [Phenylobacterium sp.]
MLIRTMRRERDWTQEQLALILGINVRTVQRLERGGVPSLETAQRLASAFGRDARLFLARAPSAQVQPPPPTSAAYPLRLSSGPP